MDDEILEAIVMVATEPIEQTAEEALASIHFAAINDGIVMEPLAVAAAMRRYLAWHDAGLIEQLLATMPAPSLYAFDCIRRTDLQDEANRRRALA